MQHINMTSTMQQGTRKDRFSFLNRLIHLMNLILILVKTPFLIKKKMILPHIQFFNLLTILLTLKNLPRFLSLINFVVSFLRLQRSLSLNTTRMLQWLTQNNISMVETLNLNLIQSPNKSTFMRVTILLITIILKTLLKQWCMSVSCSPKICLCYSQPIHQ